MTGTNGTVEEAIALSKAGKTEEAQEILLDLIQQDTHNVKAWIALAGTAAPEEQLEILKKCQLDNPQSQTIRDAIARAEAGTFNKSAARNPLQLQRRFRGFPIWLWILGAVAVLVVLIVIIVILTTLL